MQTNLVTWLLLLIIVPAVLMARTPSPLPATLLQLFLRSRSGAARVRGESSCLDTLQEMASSPAQFLTYILHSGKGINDLGDYLGCSNDPKSNYIVMQVEGLPIALDQGLCLPKVCMPEDLEDIKPYIAVAMTQVANSLRDDSDTDTEITSKDIKFVNIPQAEKSFNIYGPGFVITVGALGAIILICCYFTAKGAATISKGSIGACFDLSRNMNILVEDNRRGDADLRIFDGVRVLMIAWVVLGHVFYMAQDVPVSNPGQLTDFIEDYSKAWIYNASFSVDVFFFMSGFLLAYLLLKKFMQGSNVLSWVLYVHRAIRLYPAQLLVLVIYCFIIPAIGTGPMFFRVFENVTENCSRIWWKILLFLENANSEDVDCVGWIWYTSIDFQFFILSPFAVYLYSKWRKLGMFVLALVMAASLLVTWGIASKYNIWASMSRVNDDFYGLYYDKPYCRAPAYIVGLMLGLLYYDSRNEPGPALAKINSAISDNIVVRGIMYVAGLAGLFGLIQTMYYLNKFSKDLSRTQDMIYLLFSRPLFVVCLVLVMWPSMLGKGRVQKFLLGSHPAYVIGKLTYGIYMYHQLIMDYFKFCEKKSLYFEYVSNSVQFWPYWAMACVAATLSFLFFEQPLFNLERMLLPGGLPRKAVAKGEEETKGLVPTATKE